MAGTAILQLVTRLAIPLGIGITSAIWSSLSSSAKNAVTNLDTAPVSNLQLPYLHVFIATLSFAAVAVVVAPFARLGKLGIASTATDSSLPLEETGLKTLNLDGGGDWEDVTQKVTSGTSKGTLTRFSIQSRKPSGVCPNFNNDWQRTSTGAASFHLPRIGGSRTSEGANGLGLGFGTSDADDSKSQRTSTAPVAEKVIWLVCDDCGASKQIVEPVGDPERYFYDINEDDKIKATKTARIRVLTQPTPSSKYSSMDHDLEASLAEVGVVVDRRRFALVNRSDPRMESFAGALQE